MQSDADPFAEQSPARHVRTLQVLGARIRFDSNSRELLALVDAAYAGLPHHHLTARPRTLRITLHLTTPRPAPHGSAPPELSRLVGAGMLAAAGAACDAVVVSAQQGAALVVVSPAMLRHPYHTRYELIEFAVFTLAARAQGLVPLHAACVGSRGRGVLLVGASGAGKSTLSLQCLLHGLDFLAEDAVFITPRTLLATGVPNFLHLQADSIEWLATAQGRAAIRTSPVIMRRSGVHKHEIDLRGGGYRLAAEPLKIVAVVLLSPEPPAGGELLCRLTTASGMARLTTQQAYASGQPPWAQFTRRLSGIPFLELRRGQHPRDGIAALKMLLGVRQSTPRRRVTPVSDPGAASRETTCRTAVPSVPTRA